MPSSQSKTPAASRRNGSAAGKSPARLRRQEQSNLLPEPVREWVEEQPWALVGAAAGIGLAVGAASRHARLGSNLGQMVAATASGVAVRVAITKLVEWLEPQLERKG